MSTNATGRSLKEKVTLKSLNASSEGKDYLFSWKKRQNLIKAAGSSFVFMKNRKGFGHDCFVVSEVLPFEQPSSIAS